MSGKNAILAALSPEVLRSLAPVEQVVQTSDVLFGEERDGEYVYFPSRGAVVSILRTLENGFSVEVGVIGYEGAAPIHSFLSGHPPLNEGVIQQKGIASRVATARLREVAARDPLLNGRLLNYASGFLEMVSQNAACNRVHTIEQRLAKWLLMMRSRTLSGEMQMTHEFLSHMLGIRRAGVTVAVSALKGDGLIAHRRNSVTVIDAEGLLARACECAGMMQDILDRSLSLVPSGPHDRMARAVRSS